MARTFQVTDRKYTHAVVGVGGTSSEQPWFVYKEDEKGRSVPAVYTTLAEAIQEASRWNRRLGDGFKVHYNVVPIADVYDLDRPAATATLTWKGSV